MTHRIDSCHLVNRQYDRTESLQKKEDSFHAINRRHANPLPLTVQGCSGSDAADADLSGLKPIQQIFSTWDSSLWQGALRAGRKELIRNQYLHPWWTDHEDASDVSFGSPVKTSVVAFSVNAAFEGLSRLAYSSFVLAERVLKHDDEIMSFQKDLLELQKSQTGASKATRDIQAQLNIHGASIAAGQKDQQETKKYQHGQIDAFLQKFETWVVKDILEEKFSTLSARYAEISTEHAASELKHAASEERMSAGLDRLQCLEEEIKTAKKENENLRLRLDKVEMILADGLAGVSILERQNRRDTFSDARRKQDQT